MLCAVLPGSLLSLAGQSYPNLTAQCKQQSALHSDWEVEGGAVLTEVECLPAHSCLTRHLQFPSSVRLALGRDHLGHSLLRRDIVSMMI